MSEVLEFFENLEKNEPKLALDTDNLVEYISLLKNYQENSLRLLKLSKELETPIPASKIFQEHYDSDTTAISSKQLFKIKSSSKKILHNLKAPPKVFQENLHEKIAKSNVNEKKFSLILHPTNKKKKKKDV